MSRHSYLMIAWFTVLIAICVAGNFNPAQSKPSQVGQLYLPRVIKNYACTPASSYNLPLIASTYLGGSGDDYFRGVDISPDGDILLAGKMPDYAVSGVSTVRLLAGTNGAILRMTSFGRNLLSITKIGGEVTDLQINSDGDVVACGDFGIAVLNSNADRLEWADNPGYTKRCSIGDDGTVVGIVGELARVYDPEGDWIAQWSIGGNQQNDILVDSQNQQIIATGYSQKTESLQVAFIRAWTYGGSFRWRSYDYSVNDLEQENMTADTNGLRISQGRDGFLYFAGTLDGANSIFTRDPKDIELVLGSDILIKTDLYNDPYELGAGTFTWFGRFDPASGELIKGQFLVTRNDDNRGNSIIPFAITADESGRIYLAGEAYYQIDDRALRQVALSDVGPYRAGEAFILDLSADFTERIVWTPFSGPTGAGASPAVAVSVRQGTVATTINMDASGTLILHNSFQLLKAGGDEGYLAVWRQICE